MQRCRSVIVRVDERFYGDLLKAQHRIALHERKPVSLMETTRKLSKTGWVSVPKWFEHLFG